MLKIDEHLLKVSSGAIALTDEPAIDQDVKIILEGSVVKVEDHSNQDGTIKRIYTVKGVIAEIITNGQTHKILS